MLKICLANNSRPAVRTAAVVAGRKTIQAEHFHTTLRQMEQRGTSHAASADHDDVVRLHRRKKIR